MKVWVSQLIADKISRDSLIEIDQETEHGAGHGATADR